jgi:hypothetical protein
VYEDFFLEIVLLLSSMNLTILARADSIFFAPREQLADVNKASDTEAEV